MFEGADSADGRMSGQWSAATAAYTYVVLVVNVRVATCVNFLTSWHHIVIWGSIAFWIVFAFGYNGMTPSVDGFPPRGAFSVFGLIQYLFGTPRYFLGALPVWHNKISPEVHKRIGEETEKRRAGLACRDPITDAAAKKMKVAIDGLNQMSDELDGEISGVKGMQIFGGRYAELIEVQGRIATSMIRIQSEHPELMDALSEEMDRLEN